MGPWESRLAFQQGREGNFGSRDKKAIRPLDSGIRQETLVELLQPPSIMPEDESLSGQADCESPAPTGIERLCSRPWPCDKCSQDLTPADYLLRRAASGARALRDSLDEVIASERNALLEWVQSCAHSGVRDWELPKLAVGSEHCVLFHEPDWSVIKVTLPHTYGDYYYLQAGRVYQEACTPLQYLMRLQYWTELFGAAPQAIGLTPDGRIVSDQPFITGKPPTQDEVDTFLMDSGLEPVRRNCFLWKRAYEQEEVWIGDARDENFLRTDNDIVPIDIRLWLSNRTTE